MCGTTTRSPRKDFYILLLASKETIKIFIMLLRDVFLQCRKLMHVSTTHKVVYKVQDTGECLWLSLSNKNTSEIKSFQCNFNKVNMQ